MLMQGVDKYEFISADSPVQLTSFCGSRQNTEFSFIFRILEIRLVVKIDVPLLKLRTRIAWQIRKLLLSKSSKQIMGFLITSWQYFLGISSINDFI
jgi:hypothetical protein